MSGTTMTSNTSQIADFFKDQTIFITGGSGLVGKLLIEKLLRSCSGVKKIYALMRTKWGKSPQERYEELLNNICFERIQHTDFKSKLSIINGDCEKPFLGISEEDFILLKQETTCVLHVASNVKFDQTLKQASINIRATRDLLEIAKDMSNLKILVYVSTAYSNCIYSDVKEEFYRPPMKADAFLSLIESVDDETLQKITPLLLGKWPNAYVYMKCISEDLIKSAALKVPTAIVRPSVIISTKDEPIKGWIDNTYGFIGVLLGVWVGLVRSYHASKANSLHVIPADYVSNCILAASWKTVQRNSSSVTIYNCVGEAQPVTSLVQHIHDNYWHFPSTKYVWFKSFAIRESRFWHQLSFYMNLIPTYFIDTIFSLAGKPVKLVKKYWYVNTILDMQSYFARNSWNFDETNVMNMWNEMSEIDKRTFNFKSEVTNWEQYFYNCALGVRLYLLKDPLKTLPQGERKLKILLVTHYATIIAFIFCIYKFLKTYIKLNW